MNEFGFRVTLVGALAQVVGLGIDVWMHLKDPTLSTREALLTFSNLGHVCLLGGIGLVLAGVAIMTVGPRLARAAVPIRFGVPLAVALLVGASSVAAANSSLAGDGQDHHAPLSGAAAPHGHGGDMSAAVLPVDNATRAKLARELIGAREVAESYPTVADAEAAGYRKVTPYIPLIGAHYIKYLTVDGTFVLDEPEMLLYDGTSKTSNMVGLSYYVRGKSEPAGFAGANDHWHRHIGLCFDQRKGLVVGNEQTSVAECVKAGGVKIDGSDGWMAHAWVVPGWESTEGVFSPENPQLQ